MKQEMLTIAQYTQCTCMFYKRTHKAALLVIRQAIFIRSLFYQHCYLLVVQMADMRKQVMFYLVIEAANKPKNYFATR